MMLDNSAEPLDIDMQRAPAATAPTQIGHVPSTHREPHTNALAPVSAARPSPNSRQIRYQYKRDGVLSHLKCVSVEEVVSQPPIPGRGRICNVDGLIRYLVTSTNPNCASSAFLGVYSQRVELVDGRNGLMRKGVIFRGGVELDDVVNNESEPHLLRVIDISVSSFRICAFVECVFLQLLE